MNKNNIIITAVSIIVMLGFLVGAYLVTSQPQASEYPELKEIAATDHTKWSNKKEKVLVKFSDFQCPACAQYHNILLKELAKDKEVTDNITFVYKHFPLDTPHPHAREAAYAAEAAGKQGKFFETHDLLFANQNSWSGESDPVETFVGYAKELKLNEEQFRKDMSSKEVQDKVQNDFLLGNKVGVQGTPTFFLNGKKLNNVGTIEEFKQLLLSE
ncbi:MAG TPA: thioredoxin domain-containing protein [Candidatus Woesebacteria bacterium]|nr:thioredoxin domain-containing protein [Candidatus Woesebacteria bacterium]